MCDRLCGGEVDGNWLVVEGAIWKIDGFARTTTLIVTSGEERLEVVDLLHLVTDHSGYCLKRVKRVFRHVERARKPNFALFVC